MQPSWRSRCGQGWNISHRTIAKGEGPRAPIRPWPVGMQSTAMQGHSEVKVTEGYRAEHICHRIARTRLRELLLSRGHRDAVGSHTKVRRSGCSYRVGSNPPQDSTDRIRGLLLIPGDQDMVGRHGNWFGVRICQGGI